VRDGAANVTRQTLLKKLGAAWLAFQDSYRGLSPAQMAKPGVVGTWSVSDLIGHVTTWEEEALRHLPTVLEGGRPPRYSVTHGGIAEFNRLMTERKARFSLAELLRQQERVHRRLVALVEQVPDDQLASNTRFRRRLRLDTYGHYPGHAAAIRRWRDRRARKAKT
jgi:DinB superfamily